MEATLATENSNTHRPPSRTFWRRLTHEDVTSLVRIADTVHPGLPEDREVFSERLALYPSGCLALVTSKSDTNEGHYICGYAISHPIQRGQPPALNCLIGAIAADADQYYIHDVAILPEYRKRGLAQECIVELMKVAEQFPSTGLVSVYGTAGFWGRFGFVLKEGDGRMAKKLREYGDDAVFLERENECVATGDTKKRD